MRLSRRCLESPYDDSSFNKRMSRVGVLHSMLDMGGHWRGESTRGMFNFTCVQEIFKPIGLVHGEL
jgi:hypothetical protein